MEMAFLVLWISYTAGEAIVIPQPYLKSECEEVLKSWGKGGYCIAAPTGLSTGNIVKGNKEK